MVRKSRVSKVPSLPTIPETNNHPYVHRHSAQAIAEAFVERYYEILHQHPEDAHKFYKDQSTLSRPNADGSMRTIRTAKGINDEIMGSDTKDWTTKVLSMHAQDSLQESVFVGVTGVFRNKDNVTRYFSQNFVLAQQTNGFYVLNDFFQYINEGIIPKITAKECVQIILKDKCTSTEDDKDSSDTPPIAHSVKCVDQEDVKKETYASIVAKASLLPSSNAAIDILQKKDKQSHDPPAAVPVKPSSPPNNVEGTTAHKVLEKELNHKLSSKEETSGVKNNDQLVRDTIGEGAANKETYASIVAKPIPPQAASQQVLADKQSSRAISTTPESSSLPPKQVPAASYVRTILIKDIPPRLNVRILTKAVRDQSGSLKHKYIHIRNYKDEYRYAFMEFNHLNLHVMHLRLALLSSMTGNAQLRPGNQEQIWKLVVFVGDNGGVRPLF